MPNEIDEIIEAAVEQIKLLAKRYEQKENKPYKFFFGREEFTEKSLIKRLKNDPKFAITIGKMLVKKTVNDIRENNRKLAAEV